MKRRNFSDEDFRGDKIKSFDLSKIVKFILLNFVYGTVAFCLKNMILESLSNSPAQRAGNDFISLYEVHNTGVAFNLFENQPDIIIAVSVILVIIICFFVFARSSIISSSLLSSLAFLTSGAILNLIDRTVYGYVIDYIHIGIIPEFPTFNIPDIFIIAGVFGILNFVFKKNQDD